MFEILSSKKEKPALKYIPEIAGWEITFACNMQCKHCGSSCDRSLPDELTPQEALDLCDDLGKLGTKYLTLSGGEPFVRKDWHLIAKRLRENNIAANIISNGWFIDDSILDKAFDAGISNIAVSLDGLEPTHDFIRKKGSYARVLQALALMKKRGMPSAVCTSVNKVNLRELPKLKEILLANGVERWQLQSAKPMGNLLEHRDMIIEPSDIDKIINFTYKVMKEGQITIDIADDIGYYDLRTSEMREKAEDDSECNVAWQGCQAGKKVLGIKCNGDIIGCFSIRNDDYIEGNIRKTPLSELWTRPDAFAWSRKMKKEKLLGFCKKCQYGSYCLGGCTICKLTFGDSLYKNDYCSFKIAIEKEAVKINKTSDPEELLGKARKLIKSEEFQLADICLSRALELSPKNIEIIDLLGFVNYFMENYEAAKDLNERSLKIDPSNAYAHKGLGLCLAELGRLEDGIASLKKAIELADDNFLDPYFDLAVTLKKNNRHREAVETLEQGRTRSKDFVKRSEELFNSLQEKVSG